MKKIIITTFQAEFLNEIEDPLDSAVRKLDDLSTEIDSKLEESSGEDDEENSDHDDETKHTM